MALRTVTFTTVTWLGLVGPLTLTSLDAVGSERRDHGLQIMDHLSGGAGQPVLEALRRDYPFLAEGITDYAWVMCGAAPVWTTEPASLPRSLFSPRKATCRI